MAFSTFDFIFVFLPVFLIIYYIVPAKFRSTAMLIGSAAFYIYGAIASPWHIILLAGLIVLTYFSGIAISKETEDSSLITIILILLFGLLLFFKYNHLFIKSGEFVLPLGASFYIFSISSYIIDVFQKKIKPEKSFVRYAAYIMMFPKLISGPIVPYRIVSPDMKSLDNVESRIRFGNIDRGLRTFLYGLGLKVLIADQLSGLWSRAEGIGYESISTPMAWLCVTAFSLRLYFDFWGYSLMAVGVGEMLGYRLPANFNHPYASKSMTDFWRRWHITLGAWFRNYIYIPMGGSRCSTGRMIFNLFLVWLATGIWHGATLNYLLWAGFIFVIIVLEKLFYGRLIEKTKVISHIYMIPLILISWLLFAVTDTGGLMIYLQRMFAIGGAAGIDSADYITALGEFWKYLTAGIIFSIPAVHKFWEEKVKNTGLGTFILIVVFLVCLYSLAMGQNDPFMYFGF